MSDPRYQPDRDFRRQVCGHVEAGGNPDDAAEAAGVPHELFARWLKAGENPKSAGKYRDLHDAFRAARGVARVNNQIRVYTRNPSLWFRDDRQRDRHERSPSSGLAPPERPAEEAADPEVAALRLLLGAAAEVLEDMPEAMRRLRMQLAPHLPPREFPVQEEEEEGRAGGLTPEQDDDLRAAAPQPVYSRTTGGWQPDDGGTTAGARPVAEEKASGDADSAPAGDDSTTAGEQPVHGGSAAGEQPVAAGGLSSAAGSAAARVRTSGTASDFFTAVISGGAESGPAPTGRGGPLQATASAAPIK